MTRFFLRPLLALAMLSAGILRAEEPIDFSREILSILSDKCFGCHGPDTKKAKDLRLDSYAARTKSHSPTPNANSSLAG